jgi:hypothetical protein
MTCGAGSLVILKSEPVADIGDEDAMELRLTWAGQLLADSTRNENVRRLRAKQKHEIRRKFHEQLKRFWATNPLLCKRHSVFLA